MMEQDLLMETFHRELVIQEQAQLRRHLSERLHGEVAQLRLALEESELRHKNEKIKMRWECQV